MDLKSRKYVCSKTGTIITIGASGVVALASMQQPVFAQVVSEEMVEAEINKFGLVNDAILALVQSFTLVMLLPLGIRAGNQLFKHLILASM